ncbi:MAG: hypothetical protein L0Y44_14610 [Phycisphaerales bacterium]|nr:hypothetical protein [Phycisphaerales bacterium]MCI0676897.1 hypothetical protein [Phycisphaerales bacterium]
MVKLTGTIKNGTVVLDQRHGLPEGTRVSVEPVNQSSPPGSGDFWRKKTLQEIMDEQGIKPIRSIDDLAGGWPEDELDDGFEEQVRRWRDAELGKRE